DHGDATLAALGLGDVAWPLPDDRAAHTQPPVAGMAIAVDLRAGSRLAVRGPQAHGVARSLLMQLATSCGPADVRIVIVTAQPAAWACLRDLPHLALPDESSTVIDHTDMATVLAEWEGHRGQLVVVTDDPALLAVRTSPLRRLLADTSVHALIAVLPGDATVPHICTAALTTTDGPTAQWVADTRNTAAPQRIRVAALGERSATRATAALRGLLDPEDPLSMATNMPRALSLVDLHGGSLPDADAIVRTWAAVGRDPAPRALVGMAVDGAVDIDLVRDGPHGLIAGTTGAGKSELLRTLVVGMAANTRPEHLTFVLIDYKGGATFDACAALPHVVGVITDLDEHLADRALRSLHAELRRREALLRAHGAADLPALRATAPQVVLPRLVVVIDEFAALVSEQPTFLHALVGVAQRGRSLGVHLLLATQRPQGVISDDVRANTNLRLALRLQDAADALDVAGTADAAHLPRSVPGRAVLRLGTDEHVTFQTAHCTQHADNADSPLQLMVNAIVEAARQTDEPAPAGPWQPPLPAMLDPGEMPHGALGLIDDPDYQRVLPLHRMGGDGHLLIAGSAGSGVTSTLCTLAGHILATTADHVYVLDAHGTNEFDGLAQHPRCGAVIRIHERERVARLLHRLRARSDVPAHASPPRIVLMIDGLDTARRALDHPSTMDEYDVLNDLLTVADANAVTIIAAVEHTAAVSAAFIARCADRWVLHLHDPHDGATLGALAANVPPAQPGRVYLAAYGLTAQLVRPGEPGHHRQPITDPLAAPAPRIDTVPPIVIASSLAPGAHRDGTTALSIGVDVTTGGTHVLRVHIGEHVLVVGGARTGRTTALAHMAAQWRTLHPGGWVGALTLR
ncbi:MAG: FtsK/SpoIIIE domain-containing protein, partial [Actinomycetota bacterium]